jgi:hypothetical protein
MKNTRSNDKSYTAAIRKRSNALLCNGTTNNVIRDMPRKRIVNTTTASVLLNKENNDVHVSNVEVREEINGRLNGLANVAISDNITLYDDVYHECVNPSDNGNASSDDETVDNFADNVDKYKESCVKLMVNDCEDMSADSSTVVEHVSVDRAKRIPKLVVGKSTTCFDTSVTNCINDAEGNNMILKKQYEKHCILNGLMDSNETFRDEVRKITRRQGWKNFKLLTDDDYHYSSNFAECMLDHLGSSGCNEKDRESTWARIKKDVFGAMQISRSGATQSLKKTFLGTLLNLFGFYLMQYYIANQIFVCTCSYQ